MEITDETAFCRWIAHMATMKCSLDVDKTLLLKIDNHRRTANSLRNTFADLQRFVSEVKINVELILDIASPAMQQYSQSTHSNGLCGFLAYYQFIRSTDTKEFCACPDLKNAQSLMEFKAFYERIDTSQFVDPDSASNLSKHRNLLEQLDVWHTNNNLDAYTTSSPVLPKEHWCSDALLREYDKQCLSSNLIRILAYHDNVSGQLKLSLNQQKPLDSPFKLKRDDFLNLRTVPFMMILSFDHFYLMNNPLNGENTQKLFDDFTVRLQAGISCFESLK